MRIRSLTGKEVYVTVGIHATRIGTQWQEVDARFVLPAMGLGCVPEGFEKEDLIIEEDVVKTKYSPQKEKIMKCIREMKADPKPKDFTNAGLPNLNKLTAYAGFGVSVEAMIDAMQTMDAEEKGE
jgi:hypothetical protein